MLVYLTLNGHCRDLEFSGQTPVLKLLLIAFIHPKNVPAKLVGRHQMNSIRNKKTNTILKVLAIFFFRNTFPELEKIG